MTDWQSAYSIAWHRAAVVPRVPLLRRVNTGIISFPRVAFDPAYVDRLLAVPALRSGWPGFVEQTLWAALAAGVPTEGLDPRQAVVAQAATVPHPGLALAHLVTPIRHRAADFEARQALHEPPVPMHRKPMRRLGPVEFMRERLGARLGRHRS